jgi:hypothetical protein
MGTDGHGFRIHTIARVSIAIEVGGASVLASRAPLGIMAGGEAPIAPHPKDEGENGFFRIFILIKKEV